MLTRNCNQCQQPYDAEPRYLKRNQGLFCSRGCSAAYNATKRAVNHNNNTQCSWCQQTFYRQESHKNSKSGHYYCCKDHKDLAAGQGQHNVGPAKIEKLKCIYCHESTSSKDSIHTKCKTPLYIQKWLTGDNSVTLNYSRISGLPVDTKGFVKQYLLDKRGDQCEQCQFNTHGPYGSIIQMDHINGNCFDNSLENLKLLCPNCHAMTSTYGSRNKGSGRSHRRKK